MNGVQPGDAVEQILFKRDGDQLLHLGSREAERLFWTSTDGGMNSG